MRLPPFFGKSADVGASLANHVGSGREVARLAGHDGTVRSVRFAPRRELLASSGDDGTIRLWGLAEVRTPAHDVRTRTERQFGVDLFGTRVTWNAAPRR